MRTLHSFVEYNRRLENKKIYDEQGHHLEASEYTFLSDLDAYLQRHRLYSRAENNDYYLRGGASGCARRAGA